MSRIYTRTGDTGTTALVGGERVSKDSLRVEAYGSVDELAAILGLTRSKNRLRRPVEEAVEMIQEMLFRLSADLAAPPGSQDVPRIEQQDTIAMENLIDSLSSKLPSLKGFIIPSGDPHALALNYARTVCRRAERHTITLSKSESVSPECLSFLNRLSDALFILFRVQNHLVGHAEQYWAGRGRSEK